MSHVVEDEDRAGGGASRPSRRLALAQRASVPVAVTTVLAVSYALFFGWLSLSRYWAYEMHALDMGNMGQAAWNTIHGHPFYFTNMRLSYHALEAWDTTSRLSFHVEAIFPLISLSYFVYPHPESLLVLQTLALATGTIAVFLLARDVLENDWLAALFSAVYLIFPSLQAMNLYEFHPVALATPLLLFAFLFLHRRQMVGFVLCSLLAMGCKEEIGLVVAMFGLYTAILLGIRKVGLSLAGVGIFWSLVASTLIERHYRQPGTLSYLHTRYGYLFGSTSGNTVHNVLHTLSHDPGVFFSVLFTWAKLGYLLRMLAPVGFSALLAPWTLLLGLPTFILNIFSTDQHMYSGVGHNSAELLSVVMIGAILGTKRLVTLLHRWTTPGAATALACGWLLISALWSQFAWGYTPMGLAFSVPQRTAHQKLEDRFVAMIPPNAPVSTQDLLDPALSSRHYVYLFEDTGRVGTRVPSANYTLLDVSGPTYPLPSYELYDRAQTLLKRPRWGVGAADDGLILIKKGARSKRIPTSFYSYALAGTVRTQNLMSYQYAGIQVLGYDRARRDLANYRVPVLAYTFYLRPKIAPKQDYQPVLYELQDNNNTLLGCAQDPLGLSWLPTSKWRAGTRYRVQMDPLATNSGNPGEARFYVELRSVKNLLDTHGVHIDCGALWAKHGQLAEVGSVTIGF